MKALLNPIQYNSFEVIRDQYDKTDRPWIIGFSGGKDSSALVKIVFNVLKTLRRLHNPIIIVYCDTGVEIPVVRFYALKVLTGLYQEAKQEKLPIGIKVAIPKLKDRFFVKVIGRGYATPTNKFRWCTDRLRINPVQAIVKNISSNEGSIVLLGIRKGESQERDKIIDRNKTDSLYILDQVGVSSTKIFSPIMNYTLNDVWDLIQLPLPPFSIDMKSILKLYKDADGECPILRESTTEPCAGSRFGCWTCTVIRKDKAVTNLVANGYHKLGPLLEYRNWLAKIRDDEKYREKHRRNGLPGLGPFTLKARKEMLNKLLETENKCGYKLISKEEIAIINKLWKLDYKNGLSN